MGRTALAGLGNRNCQKFMVTTDDELFNYLQLVGKGRNISIQELFRAIVIPDWIERNMVEEPQRPHENQPSHSQ